MRKLFYISVGLLLGSIQSHANASIACTMEYAPVCASIQVQCVTAPCNLIKQTFSNNCMAKVVNAISIIPGECTVSVVPPIIGGDRDAYGCIGSAGYSWSLIQNKCVRPWEVKKMTPRQILQVGSWQIVSFNNTPVSGSGSITFSKNTFSAKLCNTMNGQYGTFAGSLIFRKVMETRMYCDTDLTMVEQALHFARAKFTVTDSQFTITTKTGDVIVWKRATL